jgi:peroxiredoxin
MSIVKIGDTAKDFELKDHYENEVRLSSLKGKTVLLSFHPLGQRSVPNRGKLLKKS